MAFEEAVKTAIFAMGFSGALLIYSGFQFKEEHVPIKLFFILLGILMIPLMLGVGVQGMQEQCTGGTCTSAQTGAINMVTYVYIGFITIFIFVLGYFILVFIRWIIATMQRWNDEKLMEEKVIK